MLQPIALAQLLGVGLQGSSPVTPVDHHAHTAAPIGIKAAEREDDRLAAAWTVR
jgi:hypothetical protein